MEERANPAENVDSPSKKSCSQEDPHIFARFVSPKNLVHGRISFGT